MRRVTIEEHAWEPCREWVTNEYDSPVICGKTSEFILWGKLFDPEALGPRCYDHASKWLNGRTDAITIQQWAIFDLRPFNPESPYAEATPSEITPTHSSPD